MPPTFQCADKIHLFSIKNKRLINFCLFIKSEKFQFSTWDAQGLHKAIGGRQMPPGSLGIPSEGDGLHVAIWGTDSRP